MKKVMKKFLTRKISEKPALNVSEDLPQSLLGERGSWLKDLVVLALIIGLLFGILLGQRFLQVPDEGRYVEIPREMLALHDFITPHINFIKYFEKPVFFYWVEALNIKLFGLSLWSVRFSTAFMAVLCSLFTYVAARKLYGRGCGILSALVLASSFLYFLMAHTVTIDMTLSTLLAGSLFSFLLATREAPGLSRDKYLWAMYVFAGLAVLTKGFVGIIFPGMIVFCWTWVHGEWKNLKNWRIPSGILILLAINLPWHIWVQIRNPEFFNFYIIDQQFLRYFTSYAAREQPLWFLPLVLFLGFLPWTFFLIQAIKFNFPKLKDKTERNTSENQSVVFLLLWASLIYLFFQCSHSQLMPYLLPIFPPLSILMARYFCGMAEHKRALGVTLGLWALSVFSLGLLVGVVLICSGFFGSPQELIPGIHSFYLVISALILLAMTGFAIVAYKNKGIGHIALVLVLGMGCFCISILLNRSAFEVNSTQPLAVKLNELYHPGDKIFNYQDYDQDLPVYTQHRVIIVNGSVDNIGELKFGALHQNMTGWLISNEEFWKEWDAAAEKNTLAAGSSPRFFMVISSDAYQTLSESERAKLKILAKTERNYLVSDF